MDADFKTRKQVNLEQMSGLIEFMQEHPDLAKGLTRGRRGKLHSVKLWNQCSKKLNPFKEGAVKDGKGWSKYWCDWKYRVRRKALELRAAKDGNRPSPDGIVPLSQMEECILGLIGENAVDGVVIKSDPLGEGGSEEEVADPNDNIDDITPEASYFDMDDKATSSKWQRRKRWQSKEYSEACGSSEKKLRLQTNEGARHSDLEDEAKAFLNLERQKLESTAHLTEAVRAVTKEVARLGDILTEIKDTLISRFNNI